MPYSSAAASRYSPTAGRMKAASVVSPPRFYFCDGCGAEPEKIQLPQFREKRYRAARRRITANHRLHGLLQLAPHRQRAALSARAQRAHVRARPAICLAETAAGKALQQRAARRILQ